VGGLGCGWAKLNVVQKRWFCVSACTSFNLRSVGIFVFRFCRFVVGRVGFLG